MIKRAVISTKNYEVIFEDEQLKATNLKTGEVFDEGYFLSIEPNKAKEHDFNLLLNTHSLVEQIPRKHMTTVLKKRLKDLESHLSILVDICMGRA
jgi:hypothetical protein